MCLFGGELYYCIVFQCQSLTWQTLIYRVIVQSVCVIRCYHSLLPWFCHWPTPVLAFAVKCYISGPLMTMVKWNERNVKCQCDTDRVSIGCWKCSQRQLPAKMADICRDWLTDQPQNAALLWLVVQVIHNPLLCSLQLKIDILVCPISWQLLVFTAVCLYTIGQCAKRKNIDYTRGRCRVTLQCFYPRDAMLTRLIVIATCPSVTRRYCVKMKKVSGMISSPSGSPKTPVFWRQISSPNSKGFPLKEG